MKYIQPWLPTWFVRFLIRGHFRFVVKDSMRNGNRVLEQIQFDRAKVNALPVTEKTEAANEQHYEVPTDFFLDHLGPRLKYSACEWTGANGQPINTLDEAEDFTLGKYADLAGLDRLPKGAKVLEMGCGWGSNILRNAEKFPTLSFTAFSNSRTQIQFIQSKAAKKGLKNVEALVEDYAIFCTEQSALKGRKFDAIFAIETLEHALDIQRLLSAVEDHLAPGGAFFVHSLLHQTHSYLQDDSTWMGRNFFTGGSILGLNSYFHFCPPKLHIEKMWPVNGKGYSYTLLAWLERMEQKKQLFTKQYGREHYEKFRMFYIMCAEAFAANDGNEFMCGYYLFRKVVA